MFVVFLLLTDPASRKANPHCMTTNKHKIVLAQAGSEKPVKLHDYKTKSWVEEISKFYLSFS